MDEFENKAQAQYSKLYKKFTNQANGELLNTIRNNMKRDDGLESHPL